MHPFVRKWWICLISDHMCYGFCSFLTIQAGFAPDVWWELLTCHRTAHSDSIHFYREPEYAHTPLSLDMVMSVQYHPKYFMNTNNVDNRCGNGLFFGAFKSRSKMCLASNLQR